MQPTIAHTTSSWRQLRLTPTAVGAKYGSHTKQKEKTKAKACLINNQYVKFVPKTTVSILVDDAYNSFAILSNLFTSNIMSNGIISDHSFINGKSVLKQNIQIDPFVEIGENCVI